MEWNEYLQIVRPTLEFLYFIANIVLLITVFTGIRQLKLVKKENKTNHERLAKEKSIDYIEWFVSDFVLEIEKLVKCITDANQDIYSGEINKNFKLNNMELTPELEASIKFSINNGAPEVLNKLEYFSIAAHSGVADKSLLKDSLARSIVPIVIFLYPTICHSRQNHDETYSNIIELFLEWLPDFGGRGELNVKESGEVLIEQIKYTYAKKLL